MCRVAGWTRTLRSLGPCFLSLALIALWLLGAQKAARRALPAAGAGARRPSAPGSRLLARRRPRRARAALPKHSPLLTLLQPPLAASLRRAPLVRRFHGCVVPARPASWRLLCLFQLLSATRKRTQRTKKNHKMTQSCFADQSPPSVTILCCIS